jgi:hypothetical protein
MRAAYALVAVLSLSFIQRTRAKVFYLKDQWVGNEFFQGWNWVTEDDPTNGRVNYVSEDEARNKNLSYGMSVAPGFSPSLFAVRPIHLTFFSGRR